MLAKDRNKNRTNWKSRPFDGYPIVVYSSRIYFVVFHFGERRALCWYGAQTTIRRTDTPDSRLVQCVTLAALARETAHRVLAPSVAANAGKLDALVDVFAVDKPGSLEKIKTKIFKVLTPFPRRALGPRSSQYDKSSKNACISDFKFVLIGVLIVTS